MGLAEKILKNCPSDLTNDITSKLCKFTGGTPEERAYAIAAAIFNKADFSFEAYLIGAFRQITAEEEGEGLSGKGLIKKLRDLQSPRLTKYTINKEKFNKINEFVKELLGEPDVNRR